MFQDRNINLLLLKRLVVLWFVASVVVGVVVYYVEIETVDSEVVALGLKEAATIDRQLIARLPQQPIEDMVPLQRVVNHMTERDFVVAEIYGKDKLHRAASVRTGNKKVSDAVDARQHQFPLDEQLHYEKFYVDEVVYIQLLLPLRHQGEVNGYFEGVYRVDQAIIDEIMARVYHTLVIVLGIILATFVICYPVILFLNRQLIKLSNDLFKANVELMEVMGSAIAKRDSVTDSHNYRVTLYAIRLGEALGFDDDRMCRLIAGAFLHDVGKIGIEDHILRKKGRLENGEFRRMKEHVLIGTEIMDKVERLSGAREVIEFHHERYDGTGYMQGLKGDEIPLNARVFAIVDVFDALASERPYKQPLPLAQVMDIMAEQRGRHFDPQLLDTFLELAPTLYRQVGQAGYRSLTRMLSTRVRKYFFSVGTKS